MANELSQFSDQLADLAESSSAYTVRVEGRRRMAATGIVWASDGIIVTANHVLSERRNREVHVGLANGETLQAEIIGRDPSTDLALLRIPTTGLSLPTWGNTDELRVGHLVLAVGRPGKNVSVTLGVLSAVGGAWQTRIGGKIDAYLQTDVVMYPGFSGGALMGATSGNVLGINTSGLGRGASIAIPAATVTRVANALLQDGRIKRGFLGVGIQHAQLPANIAEELGREYGVLVISVEPNSPANTAGIVLGDTIVAVDGEPTQSVDELLMLLSGERVGQTVPVTLLRAGSIHETSATIAERG